MYIDLIIIAIVIIASIIDYKRGFVKSISGLLTFALTVIGSFFGAKCLSNWVYSTFFQEKISQSIQSVIVDASQSILTNLPKGVVSLFNFFNVTDEKLSNDAASLYKATGEVASSVESAVSSSLIGIFNLIFIIILFIVLLFVVKRIMKLVLSLFKVPVLKQCNKILGFVMGLCKGLIVVVLAVLIIKILFMNGVTVIPKETISSTYIFSYLYNNFYINEIMLFVVK